MSVDLLNSAAPLVINRWNRFGHDRAYVACGGRDLGHRDLVTGDVRCALPSDVDTVLTATEALYAETRHVSAVAAIELLPDCDLAANRPGQAARIRARELRDAEPVRTFLRRAVGARTDERAWRIGADGEVAIARRLARLNDGWRMLHAVPVGDHGSDIDHVVIGPAGVFTVNAKNHPDASVWIAREAVKINGTNVRYVRNSRHEARRASRLLTEAAGFDVPAQGIVAFVGAERGFTVREQPADVTVLRRENLLGHLRNAPVVLDRDAIERVYAVARHLATWQPHTVGWRDFASR